MRNLICELTILKSAIRGQDFILLYRNALSLQRVVQPLLTRRGRGRRAGGTMENGERRKIFALVNPGVYRSFIYNILKIRGLL